MDFGAHAAGYRLGTRPCNLKYKASQDRGRQQKRLEPGTIIWLIDDLSKTVSNLTLQVSCSSTILLFQMSGLRSANSKCLENKSTLDNTIAANREEKSLTLGPHNFYSIKNFPVFNFAALLDLISNFIFHR